MKILMPLIQLFLFMLSVPALAAIGDPVDCSSAYQELSRKVACKVVACDPKYAAFLGTWEGPFEAYDRNLKLFRPLRNQVRYFADDCLENIDAAHSGYGDTFIIGRRIDVYPAFETLKGKTDMGLLITGRHKDGSPFLRTISPLGENDRPEETRVDYQLEFQDEKTVTSVWSSTFKEAYQGPCPEGMTEKLCSYDLKFTVSDGKRISDAQSDTRDVTVKMEIFLSLTGKKVMETVTNRGHHTKQK